MCVEKKTNSFGRDCRQTGKNREKPRRRYDSWRMFASSAVIVRADLSRRRPLSSRPVPGWYIGRTKISFYYTNPSNAPAAHLPLSPRPPSNLPARLSVIKAIHFDDDVPRILRGYFFFLFCFFNANLRTIDSAPPPSSHHRRWVSDRNHGTGDPE